MFLAHEDVKVIIVVFHTLPSTIRLVSSISLVIFLKKIARAGMTITSNRGRIIKRKKGHSSKECECLVGTRGFG
jgi:hypothetical protein